MLITIVSIYSVIRRGCQRSSMLTYLSLGTLKIITDCSKFVYICKYITINKF